MLFRYVMPWLKMKHPHLRSPLNEARLAPLSKMMHNTEKQSVLEHTDVFWGGNWNWTRERNCDSCVLFCVFFFFFKYKADLQLLRVFFTTTCRYRVIKRSHSCLKHSVCSAGQVSLQTNDSVWSRCFSPPPLRTFMFSPKPSFRSRPSDWLLPSLLAHRASRAPNSGVDRNGCVTVKLV